MPTPEVSFEIAAEFVAKLFFSVAAKGITSFEEWYEANDPFNASATVYGHKIVNRYNYVRVFGMNEEVPLLSLYINTNILEKISAKAWNTPEQLEQLLNRDTKQFSKVQETISVVATVDRFAKCMVLGKPGAGKTTLLKYIALSSVLPPHKNGFAEQRLPIFVTLKNFAEQEQQNLIAYIAQEFDICGVPDAPSFITQLLEAGKCRVLFDGLDEVNNQHINKVVKTVEDFTDRYGNNQYFITCRTAAYNHQFQRFKDVEIADFNDKQKKAFVERWFHKDPQTAQKCWEKIKADKSIMELACMPLLLTLLCISFEENYDFPRNRATLYSHAIDALLRKWDSSRKIDRGEIYKNLTLPLKEALLAALAYHTFVENQYFVAEEHFCELIKNFIQHLPNQDESRLYPDSAIILRGIDAQHSLITQRAEQVYSFSHLTLQEYFTAKYLLDNDYCTNLAQNYLSQDRWREVFLLTTNLLQSAPRKSEAFFKAMQTTMLQQVRESVFLQELLTACNAALLLNANSQYPIVVRRIMTLVITLTQVQYLAQAQGLDIYLHLNHNRAQDLAEKQSQELAEMVSQELAERLSPFPSQALSLTIAVALSIAQAPSIAQAQAQARLSKLLKTISFSKKNTATLVNYLKSCQCLADCLGTEHYLSKELKASIIDSICAVPPALVVQQQAAAHKGVRVFYSYAQEDEEVCMNLEKYLAPLRQNGTISTWHHRMVLPGDVWDAVVQQELQTAQVVILLITADFLASEKLWKEQISPAIDRHQKGEALVIPVLVRPCLWKATVLKDLQPLPRQGVLLNADKDESAVYDEVTKEIQRVIQQKFKV
ncbi:MAG: NACHT domain-containing protein [Chitinophagales bacterium]|nr:NACHT domain-containing protein [Chitinophagales bacterium]